MSRESKQYKPSSDCGHLYPDLAALGGLEKALQASLETIGSPLKVNGFDEKDRFIVYARVATQSRSSQIFIAAEVRLFLFDFWARGVMLARGQTTSLDEVARSVDKWLGSDCRSDELVMACPWVTAESNAAAHERGEEVELRWQWYLATIGQKFPELQAFVEQAAEQQKLRQLYPYTSLNLFCFSRCTGYPYTRDTPYVIPLGGGRYEVRLSEIQSCGSGNAHGAVELVVANLPQNCGRAMPGTADDLEGA